MFTQRISMDCSKEQYEKYLKEELLKMGYTEKLHDWGDDVIVNNYSSENGQLIMLDCDSKNDYSRTYLGKFNAPLFLALAAMTDRKYGGYGEWWYVMDDSSPRSFTRGKIYKGLSSIRSSNSLIDNFGDTNGYSLQENPLRYVRKATVSEIMAKFGEQPQKGKIEFEITLDTKALDEQIEKLAMSIQMTEQLIRLEGELRKAFDKKEEPKRKEPIVGEMAIMWDNNTTHAIGACFLKKDNNKFIDTAGAMWNNAILFESIEQYKKFINE